MAVPRTVDEERYRNSSRRTWRWEDPTVERNRDRIRFGSTFFNLGQFKRAVENFVAQFGDASSGPSEIPEESDCAIIFRSTEPTEGEPAYLSVEFIFAAGHRSGKEVSSRLSAAARTEAACYRLIGEINNQVPDGRYNREAIERLVAAVSANVRNYHSAGASHEEKATRQGDQGTG